MVEKLCKNCKHWTRNKNDIAFNDERFGICDKTIDISEVGIQNGLEDNIATSSDFDSYQSILETGQNFGCIHFEEGEAK